VLPPLTHDRLVELSDRTKYLLTVSITVQFYTFSKINQGNTVIIRDEKAVPYEPYQPTLCAHKVLDEDAVYAMMNATLEHNDAPVKASSRVAVT
jgi:hypothetical protein